jgi:hypothetical protein
VTDPELQGIYEMSRGTGQFMSFGDYTAGILPEIEKRITPSNLNIKKTSCPSITVKTH